MCKKYHLRTLGKYKIWSRDFFCDVMIDVSHFNQFCTFKIPKFYFVLQTGKICHGGISWVLISNLTSNWS